MKNRAAIIACSPVWTLFVVCLWPSLAGGDPVLSLPDADRRTIERDLGHGVLGEALPAPVIERPSDYLRLTPHQAIYQLLESGAPRRSEPFRLFQGPAGWQFRVGEAEEVSLARQPDGSFVLTGIRELGAGALTRYDPPEPLLFQGLEPGGERRLQMAIRVYDEEEPDAIIHRGELNVHYRYLGAFRLALPAGTFNTVLMKSSFAGRVGPARLLDTQYRFFAAGLGMVATIEHRQISALLFYRSRLDVARLLTEP